jgi:hypothetical protein
VADDRTVDESLGKAVAQRPFNLAGGIPGQLLEQLSEDESSRAALNTPVVRVLADLRNALTHGGIAYLDDRGRPPDGQAAILTFVEP